MRSIMMKKLVTVGETAKDLATVGIREDGVILDGHLFGKDSGAWCGNYLDLEVGVGLEIWTMRDGRPDRVELPHQVRAMRRDLCSEAERAAVHPRPVMKKLVRFRDKGQDVTAMEIREDGAVLDALPFQRQVWTKCWCLNYGDLDRGVMPKLRILALGEPQDTNWIRPAVEVVEMACSAHDRAAVHPCPQEGGAS